MLSQFDDEETDVYFERLNSQLRRMPCDARAELHAELRQHLDALAAAHEELGASPEEAARAALCQFGDPVKIGRRLFDEWRKTPTTSFWRVAGGSLLCLWLATFSNMCGFSVLWQRGWHNGDSTLLPIGDFFWHALAGYWAGRRFGRRSFSGLLLASAISFGAMSAIFWFSRHFVPPISYYTFSRPWILLAGAWLAQHFDGSPRLSIAGWKSRLRR